MPSVSYGIHRLAAAEDAGFPYAFELYDGLWAMNTTASRDAEFIAQLKGKHPEATIREWSDGEPRGSLYSLADLFAKLESGR